MIPDRDSEHLQLLSIFHYVWAGIGALFSCLGLLYLAMGVGLAFLSISQLANTNAPPAFLGGIFAFLGGMIVILGWTYSALLFYSGRCLSRRKHHTFCMVMACFSCLQVPVGTALGVCTILVLQRPSVRELFQPGRTSI